MKLKLVLTFFAAVLLVPCLTFAVAYAACPPADTSAGQIIEGAGQAGTNCSTAGITDTISAAVEIISVIAGIAGVIMVIWSGFRYITSGGDSGKVGNAKNSLIYAMIGLAIAALAQFLVHFVIHTASSAQPCPTNSKISATDKSCKP